MSDTVTGFRNSAHNYAAVEIPLNDCAVSYGYTGSNLTTITVVYPPNGPSAVTFVQTFTYSGSNVTSNTAFREPE